MQKESISSAVELYDKALATLEGQSTELKIGRCKDCKYFEYDSVEKVDGIPLIVAHEICSKWGNGCKTAENGYCFLFEQKSEESNITKIEEGKIYKMSNVEVLCVGFTKKGYAKMQTLGMTSGKWPGKNDISNYNDVTRAFTAEWERVIKKFKLPTLKQVYNDKLIEDALKKASCAYKLFKAINYGAWIGTPSISGGAYYIYSSGNVYNSYTSYSRVCAPFFNLNTSEIILEGNKIKIRKDE